MRVPAWMTLSPDEQFRCLISMTRDPQLREQAEALRAQGLLIREIAEEIGVPKPTVTRWLNPEFETRERAKAAKRKFSKRRKCPSCGKRMTNNSRTCLACAKRRQRYWTRERIVEAIQAWAAEHGYAPVHDDWKRSGNGHPALRSITDGPNPPFKTWGEALRAAGFTPHERRSKHRLTRQQRQELRRNRREAILKKAIGKEDPVSA